MRALVVDDDKTIRMILGNILGEIGVDTAEAENGQTAMELLHRGEKVDVMFVDTIMPVVNGHQFVRAVRANDSFNDIPIMMVTAETAMNEVQQALAEGANEYLMKPFAKDMIMEKLAILGFELS